MTEYDGNENDLELARGAVLVNSCEVPKNATIVRGYDFNEGIHFSNLMASYKAIGFQATHLAKAIEEVNAMLDERSKPNIDGDQGEKFFPYPKERRIPQCTIFLGYTSNLVGSGLREVIRFIVEHDYVDCIVTSAGGVEEDLIKCLLPSYLGEFNLDGAKLRSQGLNRAGNLLIPNNNYCAFKDWVSPILDNCLKEQEENGVNWTPSKLIRRLGEAINNEESILYWAARNNIPVFCPALTDGSLGDMLYFHSVKNFPGIRLDIVEDLRHINTMAARSRTTGTLILGGGVVKHHINNANLMRNGSDFTVFINTGMEFDGSDSGAPPDEAVSWGKSGDKESARQERILVRPALNLSNLPLLRTLSQHITLEAINLLHKIKQNIYNQVTETYQKQYDDMTPFVKKILASNVRVLLYYGDTDMSCNFMMGQQFTDQLGHQQILPKTPWKFNGQIAGFKTLFDGLTFITVRGAGHMAPQGKAPQTQYVIQHFLNDHSI